MPLGKLLNLSGPQFPYLYHVNNNNFSHMIVMGLIINICKAFRTVAWHTVSTRLSACYYYHDYVFRDLDKHPRKVKTNDGH